jgi:hypothetical protein
LKDEFLVTTQVFGEGIWVVDTTKILKNLDSQHLNPNNAPKVKKCLFKKC